MDYLSIFYKEFGKHNKEVLLILHGLMGNLDNWQTPARKYAERFHVFTLDARNHGHSPHSNDFNYELMMKDLLNFVEKMELENFFLLGHSMGGKTAMKFTQNYPDFVEKLIVADIAPKSYPVHHQLILEGLSALDFDVITSRGEADAVLSKFVSDQGVRQFLLKSLYWKEKGKLALRFNLEAISAHIEEIGEATLDLLSETETLFIRGANSDYIKDKDLDDLKISFPNSKVDTIEEAGHWLHAEKPEEFIERTTKFLIG